jgi:hypothetical protein
VCCGGFVSKQMLHLADIGLFGRPFVAHSMGEPFQSLKQYGQPFFNQIKRHAHHGGHAYVTVLPVL